MKPLLRRAMLDSDNYVIEMEYADSKGVRTRRVVSPIRFVGNYRFLGLCLCREEPRQFQLSRCKNLRLIPASDVVMPVPMIELTDESFGESTPIAPISTPSVLAECLV